MIAVTNITDMHIRNENTLSEPLLLENQDKVMKDVLNVIKDISSKYDKHYVVFNGDIVNTKVSDTVKDELLMWLRDIKENVTELWSVIGNHELSYKLKGNIFWEVAYGNNLVRPNKYKLLRPLLNTGAGFRIGKTYFALWNYNEPWPEIIDDTIEEIVVIGHNAVSFPGLKETYMNNDIDIKDSYVRYYDLEKNIKNQDKLKWIFLGHMHTLVGRFRIQETIKGVNSDFWVENMGSLGRPNSEEFNIQNERNISSIIINEDGVIEKVENHIVTLSNKESLKEEELERRREVYKSGKYIKQLRQVEYSKVNVIEEILDLYKYDMDKTLVFKKLLSSEPDTILETNIVTLENISPY